MLCKKCGATVPDNTYKCPFCNAKLGDEPIIEEEIIEEETVAAEENNAEPEIDTEEIFDENEMNRREQVKRMLDEKQQQLSEIQDRREAKKKQQQRNKTIIIALVCVLVSVAVGSGAYLISNGINKRPVVTINTPEPEVTEDPSMTEAPEETIDPSSSPEAEESPSPSPESGQAWQATEPDTTSASTSTASTSANAKSNAATGSSTSNTSNTSSTKSNATTNTKSNTATSTKSNATTSTKSNAAAETKSNTTSTKSNTTSTATKVVNTGITTKSISSMITKGSAVVYDDATGKYVMSFISDGTEYYAYVSAGSTTAQVKNKTIKISAIPSENTYKGSTVYTVTDMTYMSGDFIIADSSTRLLTESDVAGLTKEQLGYARNEIFARHGRPFKTKKYKEYFAKCSWYKVSSSYNLNDDKSNLNSIEKQNVDFILMYENK